MRNLSQTSNGSNCSEMVAASVLLRINGSSVDGLDPPPWLHLSTASTNLAAGVTPGVGGCCTKLCCDTPAWCTRAVVQKVGVGEDHLSPFRCVTHAGRSRGGNTEGPRHSLSSDYGTYFLTALFQINRHLHHSDLNVSIC